MSWDEVRIWGIVAIIVALIVWLVLIPNKPRGKLP